MLTESKSTLVVFGPFALVLISLALGPSLLPRLWARIENYFLVFVSLLGGWLVWTSKGFRPIIHTLTSDYVPFIVMMTVLSLVSSLLAFQKGGKASPLYNTLYLAVGAIVANIIGTIAAAMVMWPPFTHLNRHQGSFRHGVVFFIFIICNVGACLTPLGDPPLLVGYLRGVPFGWMFLHAWKAWVLAVIPLLGLFYLLDKKFNPQHEDPPHILRGPSLLAFAMITCILGVMITCPSPYREIGLLMVGIWAWGMKGRIDAPMFYNIACLFLALFITLIPVQFWLAKHAHYFVNQDPFFNFWTSGLFSAFLDNTPTYIIWSQLHHTNIGFLSQSKPHILEAISLGCVWMGALSYIGNAPNLIVRAYAHKHAPSFLGYMGWSCGILIPLFYLISLILW